ncbi:ATP synthase subunit I [Arthrobacter sp. E3]|uniref:ATP synthase subunit I n=1 Tax=Arthrobacter sp. E3 TaxID=517402 RepID=UPI001A94C5B3|nr:ATP synthase subunit I [Arthrobacter sp. E3]
MKDKSTHPGAAPGHVAAAGPSASPSWNILKKCLLVDGIAVVILAVLAFVFTNADGVLSVLFGSLLVMAFFGLSLLVGHIFSKRKPRAVISIFFMTYFVKVVGFAAVLFALGTPPWLNKPWFLAGAVVCVLVWQGTEVVIFSKQRFLLFDDPAEPSDGKKPKDTSP